MHATLVAALVFFGMPMLAKIILATVRESDC